MCGGQCGIHQDRLLDDGLWRGENAPDDTYRRAETGRRAAAPRRVRPEASESGSGSFPRQFGLEEAFGAGRLVRVVPDDISDQDIGIDRDQETERRKFSATASPALPQDRGCVAETAPTFVPPIVGRDELEPGVLVEPFRIPQLSEKLYAIIPNQQFPNPLPGDVLPKHACAQHNPIAHR